MIDVVSWPAPLRTNPAEAGLSEPFGLLAPAPHAVEAPISKVRLRRVRLQRVRLRKVRLRQRGLAADARHVRHIPWFILIVIPIVIPG